jgi:Leucine-rich repeat (LRR) protein
MMKLLYVVSFLLLTMINCFAQKIEIKTYSLEQALLANPDTIFALDLSHLKLDTVPFEIAKFTRLNYLDLSKNKLSKLPDFLADLEYLKTVNISKNKFDVFPLVLTRIDSLTVLLANRNQFDRLPESIGYCKNLEVVDFWETPIMSIPESFYALPKLKKIDLQGIKYSPTFQKKLKDRLPNVEIKLDSPCDCME